VFASVSIVPPLPPAAAVVDVELVLFFEPPQPAASAITKIAAAENETKRFTGPLSWVEA
jgi:hypothetical protein